MKPNYGIDAPPVIRNLLVVGIPATLVGLVFPTLGVTIWAPGVCFILTAGLMVLYAKVGKFGHRERMLDLVPWRGDENVLDVGTGRGLLLIGAAKRLDQGKSYGIDIWNSQDLSNNSAEHTQRNVELEGVKDRTEILNESATKLSFENGFFDLIFSNLCLHNLPSIEDRAIACREIARVLKKQGTAIISDFQKLTEYETVFRSEGCEVSKEGPFFLSTFPPLSILRVTKV